MGILTNLLKPKKEKEIKKANKLISEYFGMINGYTPSFTTFEGSLYEMDLTKSVIHSFATHVSKLNMEVQGSANINLKKRLKYKANDITDTSKYLYRLATILQVTNNAIIIPTYDELTGKINGYYPIIADGAKLVEYENELYLVYNFLNKKHARPLSEVGIMNQFQFKNELFGDNNKALKPTLNLLHKQEQGIVEAIKNGASIRFMGQLASVLRDDDIEAERLNFAKRNFGANDTGLLLFDNKYKEVKQVTSTPYTIDDKQMQQIKDSVYTHFGTNDKILQNKFNSQEWAAYYEGKLEPFAIQASLVHTNMTFTDRELANGNEVMLTANRMQYLSPTEKLQIVTQLLDRGMLTPNEGREIYNMTPIEDGDKYYIRKEYAQTMNLDDEENTHKELSEEDTNNEQEGGDNEQGS
ncbi:phage portal protein [Helcococcus ovis]|uniref:phage portal protein n=1 Tax=Helcococcus ovis TaxID=72026 RepID=UPI0038BA2002